MAQKISDVNVGLPSRKWNEHPINHTSSTTLNFGEVACITSRWMDGKSKIKGSIPSLVRMSPLPLPTFGELQYKTYARFVPMRDIFRNWENLRGARSLTTQFGTFTPTAVPYCTVSEFSAIILKYFCKLNIYYNSDSSEYVYSGSSSGSEYLDAHDQALVNPISSPGLANGIISDFNTYWGTDVSTSIIDAIVKVTPSSADFVLGLSSAQMTGSRSGGALLCFRLTRLGKILYRNFVSLGYKFDLRNFRKVNVLKLFAFYKGYWDLFIPANTANSQRNFTDSYCFRLCDYICEHDVKNVVTDNGTSNLFVLFLRDEFSQVFYYQKPDFITSMVASPSISPATTPGVSPSSGLGDKQFNSSAGTNAENLLPSLRSDLTNSVAPPYTPSAWNIKLLLRLLPYINKDTVIGGRLRELIKSRYGYDPETLEGYSYSAGKFTLNIGISAITSQADTYQESNSGSTGLVMGQQGGVGVGYTQKDKKGRDICLHVDFMADQPGYMMFYAVIIPKAGFCQGISPDLKIGVDGRFSIYDSAFDSLGFDLYTKDLLLGENLVDAAPDSSSGTFSPLNFGSLAFGYSPRYFDVKNQAHDIVSGDLYRLPYRGQYSPYYMSKLITGNYLESSVKAPDVYDVTIVGNRHLIPTATPQLREIGFSQWLENFNRIFYQMSLVGPHDHNLHDELTRVFGVDDNFVVHNEVNLSYFDHSKPSSDSFETDGEGPSLHTSHA